MGQQPPQGYVSEIVAELDFEHNPDAHTDLVPLPGDGKNRGWWGWCAPLTEEGKLKAYADVGVVPTDGVLHLSDATVLYGLPCSNYRLDVQMHIRRGRAAITLRKGWNFELRVILDSEEKTISLESVHRTYRHTKDIDQELTNLSTITLAKGVFQSARRRLTVSCQLVENRVCVTVNSSHILESDQGEVWAGNFAIYGEDLDVYQFVQIRYLDEAERKAEQKVAEDMTQMEREMRCLHSEDIRQFISVKEANNELCIDNAFSGQEVLLSCLTGRVTFARSTYGDELIGRPSPEITLIAGKSKWVGMAQASRFELHGEGLELVVPLNPVDEVVQERSLQAEIQVHWTPIGLWRWQVKVEDAPEDSFISLSFWPHSNLGLVDEGSVEPPANSLANTGVPIIDADWGIRSGFHATAHNGRSGFSVYAGRSERCRIAEDRKDARLEIIHAYGPVPFTCYTLFSPHQPLAREAITKPVVHCTWAAVGDFAGINGDVPDRGSYPSDDDLREYARRGARAIYIHHQWVCDIPTRRGVRASNDEEMSRIRKTCDELGLELSIYWSPHWWSYLMPGTHLGMSTHPCYYLNGTSTNYFFFSASSGETARFYWREAKRLVHRYALDGLYLDGAYSVEMLHCAGPEKHTMPEDKGSAEFHWAAMDPTGNRVEGAYWKAYGTYKILQDKGATMGVEGYGEAIGPLRCMYSQAHLYGESRDYFSPETMRNHQNLLLNGCAFRLWASNPAARTIQDIGICGVSLANIEMIVSNERGGKWGCEPVTEEEWQLAQDYWTLLSRIDIKRAKLMPWWLQEAVLGDFYAGGYVWDSGGLFFMLNRTDRGPCVERMRIDRTKLGLQDDYWRIRQIYPETAEWGYLNAATEISVSLPAQVDGYIAWEIYRPG